MAAATWVFVDSDWLYIFLISLTIIMTVPAYFLFYEPVKQLYKKGNISDMFRILYKVNKRNNKGFTFNQIQDSAEITEYDLEQTKFKIESQVTWEYRKQQIKQNLKDLFFSKYFIRL